MRSSKPTNKPPRKSKSSASVAMATAPRSEYRYWAYAAGVLLAIFAVFEVYWPAIHGPFLLDDSYLPYRMPYYAGVPLKVWTLGLRPLLMFTFWLNYQGPASEDTFGYHLFNVVLHFFNGVFILLASRKVLSWAQVEKRKALVLSIFASGLFLLHPLQTESVSYIASRSETLSVFWVLAAFTVFVYRRGDRTSVFRTIAILLLFAAGVASKEHTAVLPALLLLTDYYWNPGFSFEGIRRNWMLYVPIAIGAVAAAVMVFRILGGALTAGFGFGVTWYQYFFTECRVLWDYLRLFVLPLGQNVDADVPVSRTILDHGAIFALAALVAVSVVAWIYRRRSALASYGWFTFLILLAPTSSFVPIQDPSAERRLYLPFIGLLFIVVDFIGRWKAKQSVLVTALSAVLIFEAALTYQRNQLWSNAIDLWKDSVANSPNKYRPRFQLAFAYFLAGDNGDAIQQFQKLAELGKPTFELMIDWGEALDGAGKTDEALEKFKQAAEIEKNAHVYSQIGMEYGKMGKYPEALDALATAEKLDPRFAMTYYTRGNVYESQGNKAQAAEEYQRALVLDAQLDLARDALKRVSQ